MARESSLWAWLSKVRLQCAGSVDIHRVENACEEGMPDVEGYLKQDGAVGQFWLELKSEERPARASTPIRFKVREKQIPWINRRWSLGANVFWLVQIGSHAERTILLLPGPLGMEMQRGMLEAELMVAAVHTGIWTNRTADQRDVIRRAVTCRDSSRSSHLAR